MIRVCPHSDRTCQWGMYCPHTCATGEYDGTKRLIPNAAKALAAANHRADEAFKLLERLSEVFNHIDVTDAMVVDAVALALTDFQALKANSGK